MVLLWCWCIIHLYAESVVVHMLYSSCVLSQGCAWELLTVGFRDMAKSLSCWGACGRACGILYSLTHEVFSLYKPYSQKRKVQIMLQELYSFLPLSSWSSSSIVWVKDWEKKLFFTATKWILYRWESRGWCQDKGRGRSLELQHPNQFLLPWWLGMTFWRSESCFFKTCLTDGPPASANRAQGRFSSCISLSAALPFSSVRVFIWIEIFIKQLLSMNKHCAVLKTFSSLLLHAKLVDFYFC